MTMMCAMQVVTLLTGGNLSPIPWRLYSLKKRTNFETK